MVLFNNEECCTSFSHGCDKIVDEMLENSVTLFEKCNLQSPDINKGIVSEWVLDVFSQI